MDTFTSPTVAFHITAPEYALPLYTISQLRALEIAAASTLPPSTLMTRAGRAAAAFIRQRCAHRAAHRIWMAVGPGNNGGDALAAAAELHTRGYVVEVCMPVCVHTEDARRALEKARVAGVPITDALPDGNLGGNAWAVDGLFGIGLTRPLESVYAALVRRLSQQSASGCSVLALDIPSGLACDTGSVGPGGDAVRATHTLTFIGAKAGLYTAYGRDYAGEIWLAPLGLEAAYLPAKPFSFAQPPIWLNAPPLFSAHLPQRPHASHKGHYGTVQVLGGDTGMRGAPILAARAALFAGAGKVRITFIGEDAPAYDPLYPELMLGSMETFETSSADVWVIGCGMGQAEQARAACAHVLTLEAPKVIDADALNWIAHTADFAARCADQPNAVVLTPHPLEAARLLHADVETIQHDRLTAARTLAAQYACTVVLKGSGTVVASFDGRLAVNPTGHAGLATGGSGDVLSGLMGALMAQRMPPFEAALAAVFLHGRAAEILADEGMGPAGLNAGALAPVFRRLLNTLMDAHGAHPARQRLK